MSTIFVYPPQKIDTTGLATEASQATQITEAQTTNTKLEEIKTKIDTTNTKLDTVNTSIGTTNTKLDTVTTSVDTVNTTITATNTKIDSTNTKLTDIEADTTSLVEKLGSAQVTEKHDYIELAYVGSTTDISSVVYKDGGASGTTVATLTLAYDGSNRLTSITKT